MIKLICEEEKRRADVMRLAKDLSNKTKINIDTVYYFLMSVMRSLHKNPNKLKWITRDKILFPEGMCDKYCLSPIDTSSPRNNEYYHGDYEGSILARQDYEDI